MQQSKSLLYATSRAANGWRWVPWELGYSDGYRDGTLVSILPVEGGGGETFDGQEYLRLHKVVEKVRLDGLLRPYVLPPSRPQAESLTSFANVQGEFLGLVMR